MTGTHALLIGGRSGVGESTVAIAIHELLATRSVRHAMIEGDNLDLAFPTPWQEHTAARMRCERRSARMLTL